MATKAKIGTKINKSGSDFEFGGDYFRGGVSGVVTPTGRLDYSRDSISSYTKELGGALTYKGAAGLGVGVSGGVAQNPSTNRTSLDFSVAAVVKIDASISFELAGDGVLEKFENLERGIDISHETVRYWWNSFGPLFASEIKKSRIRGLRSSKWKWHLDEVFVKINGETHYLWRAVDHEAALKFLRKLMRKHGQTDEIVTDGLKSYGAAFRDLNASQKQSTGRWMNNRAENTHLPFRRRERAMLRFRRMRCLQKFVSLHASVYNHFNQERLFQAETFSS